MTRNTKILLGLATLWPLIYLFCFLGFFVFTLISIVAGYEPSGPPFAVVGVVHLGTMLWLWGLIAIYCINVMKSNRMTQDKKALWIVVIFLGNMFAMPIYWYFYIRPKEGPQNAVTKQGMEPS